MRRRFPKGRHTSAKSLNTITSGEEQEVGIIVQGTRLGRRLHHEPPRVEVTAGEEIEEKALMRPGNIAMLVNEIGGVRVQVTSPELGAANVRIQGLEGRYTQLRHS